MERLLLLVRQADIGVVDIDVEDEEVKEEREGFARDLAGLLFEALWST